MSKGNLEKAIEDFSHAIKIAPRVAPSYMNRGLALLVMGRDAEAQKDFDKCWELEPDRKSDVEERIEIAKRIRSTQP